MFKDNINTISAQLFSESDYHFEIKFTIHKEFLNIKFGLKEQLLLFYIYLIGNHKLHPIGYFDGLGARKAPLTIKLLFRSRNVHA